LRGSGLQFRERGAAELEGVPGEWRLYSIAGAPPAEPLTAAPRVGPASPRTTQDDLTPLLERCANLPTRATCHHRDHTSAAAGLSAVGEPNEHVAAALVNHAARMCA
jgi:hypothetical protein